jgi:tetratricopeptide (TPR) repeat protein
MTTSRLDRLREFLTVEPGDVFTHYAIALEYVSLKRLPDAVAQFEEVITLDPSYFPAYHQLGLLLSQLRRTEEAARTLDQGIDAARNAGDNHAVREMQEAIDELGL